MASKKKNQDSVFDLIKKHIEATETLTETVVNLTKRIEALEKKVG